MSIETLNNLGDQFALIFFVISGFILIIEIFEAIFKGSHRRRTFFEMLVSASTQIPSIVFEAAVMSVAYAVYYIIAETLISWSIPLTWWSILLGLLIADFVYYWEHRTAHEIRLLWTQHAVHHSSRDFNIITAFRFGPAEGLWAFIVHLPMVLLGFPPEMVFVGQLSVLAYQTWLHTETIGKLGPLEKWLNTPSHHRVHHGSDDKYLDKNYAGILIVWDRMFGTFQAEEERPCYGLKRNFDSQNPLQVWFSELPGLWNDMRNAKNWRELRGHLFAKPGWEPGEKE